ncbi:DEAD/DEAH box helicase, partial [Streptococcus sp. S784/96/1]|uniref:DEAD/DEAH box helicase n=1 Tax=Streptococcus sp. S784/96/1 TaxID=2653499 RepID=UPI0013866F4C
MKDFYGRLFIASQLSDDEKRGAKTLPAMIERNEKLFCNRCGSKILEDWLLPRGEYYCRECLILGRNRQDYPLFYFPAQPFPKEQYLTWKGQLTSYQQEVSDCMKRTVANKENLLIHAVTGAGKTEMIYETVSTVLEQGGQVCLASPRIDVCLELYKRLSRDFSCPITLLHGESEPYFRAPLVIATTHQLLKFYQAFDLLIIDEVDAFPFVDNTVLYYALEQALKQDGVKFFLTATSTDALDKQVRQGKLKKCDLARRFHANPLVVPKMKWLGGLLPAIQKGKLPKKLIQQIATQRETDYPLLIFFPHIEIGKRFTELLKKTFPQETIGFVASTTDNRLELVQQFRDKKLSILVSTTILERGVTFPCVDVFVLWSNHQLYTRSSLVQIGGRVGRAMERPTGELIFFH